MLLYNLAARLHNSVEKRLRTVHNTALQKERLYVIQRAVHLARLCICACKSCRQVATHLCSRLRYLLLTLTLQVDTPAYAFVYSLLCRCVRCFLVLKRTSCQRCVVSCTNTSYTANNILTFYKPSAHLSKIAHNVDKTMYLSLRFAHVGSQRYAAAKLTSERSHLIAKRVITSLRCLYLRQSLLVVAIFLSPLLAFRGYSLVHTLCRISVRLPLCRRRSLCLSLTGLYSPLHSSLHNSHISLLSSLRLLVRRYRLALLPAIFTLGICRNLHCLGYIREQVLHISLVRKSMTIVSK